MILRKVKFYTWSALLLVVAIPFAGLGAIFGALFSTAIRSFAATYKFVSEAILNYTIQLRKEAKGEQDEQ